MNERPGFTLLSFETAFTESSEKVERIFSLVKIDGILNDGVIMLYIKQEIVQTKFQKKQKLN